MAFLTVLLVVIADYWLKVSNHIIPKSWLGDVCDAIEKYAQSPDACRGLSGAFQVVLIPTLIIGAVFWLAEALFGVAGYFVLGLFWLWYIVDFSCLKQDNHDAIFANAYQEIFAKLFWFSLFGPVGLALQFIAEYACHHLSRDQESVLRCALGQLLAALDWVPVRLYGLSFALVGAFSHTLPLVKDSLQLGLSDATELATQFGHSAMQNDESHPRRHLITRALWLWLVVMALISIGMLL